MQPILVLLPNLEIHKIVPPRHFVKAVVLEAKTQFGHLSKFLKKKKKKKKLLLIFYQNSVLLAQVQIEQ